MHSPTDLVNRRRLLSGPRHLRSGVIAGQLLVLSLAVGSAAAQTPESIASRGAADPAGLAVAVRELLAQECLECHGPTKQAGDLRLDSRAGMAAGGHSGNAIVGATPESSELLLRLTASDPKYRMPRERPPLPANQIDVVRRWIAAGAPTWPPSPNSRGEVGEAGGPPGRGWLDWLDRTLRPLRPLILPVLAALLAIWWLETKGNRLARKSGTASPPQAVGPPSRWNYVWLGCAVGLAAAWLSTRADLTAARQQLADAHRQSGSQAAAEESPPRSELGGPLPLRPKHPPRLGGVYYRGNDERDPQLFNGGFYRTADLRLWLADAEQQPLQWGSPIGRGTMWIGLRIDRAPHATPQLFTPRIMETVFLSRHFETAAGIQAADDPVRLVPTVPGAAWEAFYPIGDLRAAPGGRLAGVVYLYKSREPNQTEHAKFHFGIRYDIRASGEVVGPDSELWMNALSWPFAVDPPRAGAMTADEWFDFRPMPEIVGENSTDPGLLGIPEYEPPAAPSPTPSVDFPR